jgi:hypothetical protein
MSYALRAMVFGLMAVCWSSVAWGQGATVYQNGNVVPNHLAKWFTNGRIGDVGGLQGDVNGQGISPFIVTDNNGNGECLNSAVASGPYNGLCFGHSANGTPTISVSSFGGFAAKPLEFVINGVRYDFPYSVGGIVGPTPTVVGDPACWNNTSGSLLATCVTGKFNNVSLITMPTGSIGGNCFVAPLGCVPEGSYAINMVGIGQTAPWENLTLSGATNGFVLGQAIVHNFGGPTVNGGRESFAVFSVLAAPTSSSNLNRNYVAGVFQSSAQTGDGGADDTNAGSKGGIFGINPLAVLYPSATHLHEVTAGEVNIQMLGGSSAWYKALWTLVPTGADAVHGSEIDVMLSLSAQTGAVGFNSGILITDANGQMPLTPTATIFGGARVIPTGGPWAVAKGLDLTSFTFSDSSIRVPGFIVGGSGHHVEITGPAATPLAALGVIGTTTASAYAQMINTGADLIWGIEGSVGSVLVGGTTPYSSVLGTQNATSLHLIAGNGVALTIAQDGGILIGNPTGGTKGPGTINVAAGLYLNGAAYTFP